MGLLVEMRVPVISFSFGVDERLFERAKAAGMTVLVQVGDLETGLRAASLGADAVIAQGTEAGGHIQWSSSVEDLVRRLS